jgi:hypothetical protein
MAWPDESACFGRQMRSAHVRAVSTPTTLLLPVRNGGWDSVEFGVTPGGYLVLNPSLRGPEGLEDRLRGPQGRPAESHRPPSVARRDRGAPNHPSPIPASLEGVTPAHLGYRHGRSSRQLRVAHVTQLPSVFRIRDMPSCGVHVGRVKSRSASLTARAQTTCRCSSVRLGNLSMNPEAVPTPAGPDH